MTSSIIDFLEARLAEDEHEAHVAAQGIGDGEWGHGDRQVRSARLTLVAESVVDRYIARHDPARVLREVQAKRRILKEHSTPHTVVDGFCTECGSDLQGGVHKRDRSYCEIHGWRECETVLALAAIYSDHEAYRKEWAA